MTLPKTIGTPRIWTLTLLLAGAALLWPFYQLQGYLSTGDHGRELYAFAHIFDGAQGQTPYQDYWWMYGPLMIYYYGLFMKVFGVSLLSVLIGKTVLLLITGTFIGLTVMALGRPLAGLAAAAWFWITFPNFFHTHNHTGGLACIAALAFCLVSYIKTDKLGYLLYALFAVFLLALIKLNIGIVALATNLLAVFIIGLYDRKLFASGRGWFFFLALLAVPLLVAGIHALMLHGLSTAEVRQCFPFGTHDRQYSTTPWESVITLAVAFFTKLQRSWTDLVMAALVFISACRLAWLIFRKQLEPVRLRALILSLLSLGILFTAMAHEYLFSGVNYCLYWSQPVWMTIMFVLIAFSSQGLGAFWKTLQWSMFGLLLIYLFAFKYLNSVVERSPERFFRHPRVQAYLQNDYHWTFTVNMTVALLKKNLRPGETFFAFPYDPLFYYLTDRRTPTWQTCFFAYQHIPSAQERATMSDLKKKQVNWAVVSNRIVSDEAGLGVLGRDYCPLLAQYLDKHFAPAFYIGDWKHQGGWAWNYGVMLLKRKAP